MEAKVHILGESAKDSNTSSIQKFKNDAKSVLLDSSEELIPIKEEDGKVVVSARDLHQFLEVSERFSSWFERQVQFGFIEDEDFTSVKSFTLVNNGAEREVQDYAITLDMAKEISMIQRNDKGKQARRYFIACEKRLRKKEKNKVPRTYLEALKALVAAEEEKERLMLENAEKQRKIEEQAPKAEYFDNLVERNLLTNFRDTAKEIGLKQNQLIKLLLEHGFVYRDQRNKLKPYAEHVPDYFEIKDYEHNGHAGTQTMITPKGKEAFRLMFGNGLR